MKKLIPLLISLIISFNSNAQSSPEVTWVDLYDFEEYVEFDQKFRELAMSGYKGQIKEKLRTDLISLTSKRISEANLAGAVSFPAVESYIKSSKGLAKAVALLTPTVSLVALGSSLLTDGVNNRGTSIAAYRLIADSVFFTLGLTSTFALPMLTVAIIDYSLNTYITGVQRDYESYWLQAYDWYFFKRLEIKYSKFHKLTDISRYVIGAQSDAVKTMQPWNAPDFVRFTDQFWDDSSIIAQEFNTAYPSVMSMFYNSPPVNEMNRIKFRAFFYAKRLHAPMRSINQSLVREQKQLLLERSKEAYRELLAGYLKHFSKPIQADDISNEDDDSNINDNNDDEANDDFIPGQFKGYAIAQATSNKRTTPHYFLVDVSKSGLSGQMSNTDLRAYGFCTGNSFQELMDYKVITEIYKTRNEAVASITAELTEARITGLGCRYYRAMEFGVKVYISNRIFDYIRNL